MKKLFCLALLSLFTIVSARAQSLDKYSVTLMGVYGWNQTWKSHGGLDVIGYFPINQHFEAVAAAEYLSPKVFGATVTARPKFPLPVGEIFLDGSVHFRNFGMYKSADFTLAASAGYRMDYVSAQFGLISHTILDMERDKTGSSENLSEPFNMLYRVAFNVRPSTSRWNAGAGAANYTDFEYERTWEPMYFLHGKFNVDDHFTVLLRGDLKPAGAFHLNAQFWGVSVRAGVKYVF